MLNLGPTLHPIRVGGSSLRRTIYKHPFFVLMSVLQNLYLDICRLARACRQRAGYPLVLQVILLPVVILRPAEAQSHVEINLTQATDRWLASEGSLLPPDAANGPVGLPPLSVGWFDYEFTTKEVGWYVLVVESAPAPTKTEFIVDAIQVLSGQISPGNIGGPNRVGSVWLAPGSHTLRIQNFFWTGFPKISKVRLEGPSGVPTFALMKPGFPSYSLNSCLPIEIEAGGNEKEFLLEISFRTARDERQVLVPVVSSPKPIVVSVPPVCDLPGAVQVDIGVVGSNATTRLQTKYFVFGNSEGELAIVKGNLVTSIDAGRRVPDFASGQSSVVNWSAGTYRESSASGSTPYVRHPYVSAPPGWFSYAVDNLTPGLPYIFEIEYPDDAERVFVASVRDEGTSGYTASLGMETGGIWPLSNVNAKKSLVVWPSGRLIRVLLVNVHSGMRAALSRINIYQGVQQRITRPKNTTHNRDFSLWNEEGSNFRAPVGVAREASATFDAVERYMALVAGAGASLFFPTAVVYDTQMYPSKFNLAFRESGQDELSALLLGARKFGLKVVPQLHPRADELLWKARNSYERDALLARSRSGNQHLLDSRGSIRRPPFFNPLNKDVRSWYVGMIGELADRFSEFPEFVGVDLRVSSWQNPGFNNFVSLDWGYDYLTVSEFYTESGIQEPAGLDLGGNDPQAEPRRYRDLISNHRRAWIDWRCRKITSIFADIASRIRRARPDLNLYVSLVALLPYGRATEDEMRQMGIDIEMLSKIDGLILVDAQTRYGAREGSFDWRRKRSDETSSFLTYASHDRPRSLIPMQYIEIPGGTVSASQIGLPPTRNEPYTSAASEPPGRFALARFAKVLGLADVFMLGDGGNGFFFGSSDRVEFVNEFRNLPMLPFERVPEPQGDDIAIWQQGRWFYVVNMTDRNLKVSVSLVGTDYVTRVSTDENIRLQHGIVDVELRPFDLRVFGKRPESRVTGASIIR